MITYKFSKTQNAEFSVVLRKRVNAFFKEAGLKKGANFEMLMKTLMALAMYLVPFAFILFAGITNLYILFSLFILMGLGKAFIGTSVMHDAVHESYSSNKVLNKFLALTAPLVGIDSTVWKLQHNVLHHTYTNIEHADEDISPRYVLRFSPHQPKRWFHKFQHLYVWFFYSISTLVWVVSKDYFKLFNYKKMGLLDSGRPFRIRLLKTFFRKAAYLAVFLALPIYILNIPAGITLLMFISMHCVTGLSLSLIFQSAHIIESSEFIEQKEELIEESWSAHQLRTTANFAPKNKILTWFSGGLNHQVEHHLFPNICHIHYPKISSIVKRTAAEFNLPYHVQESFHSAVFNHYKMLRQLGRA